MPAAPLPLRTWKRCEADMLDMAIAIAGDTSWSRALVMPALLPMTSAPDACTRRVHPEARAAVFLQQRRHHGVVRRVP